MPVVLISRYLFYAALVVVSYLALVPQEAVLITTGWDKTNHYLAFMVLLALFDHAYPRRSIWRVKLPWLVFYAVLIEIIQAEVPGRDASLLDLLADGLGLLAYIVIRPLVVKVFLSASLNSSNEEGGK